VHDDTTMKTLLPYVQKAALAFPKVARAAMRMMMPTELALQYGMFFEVNRHLVRREDFQP
jgi:hypothetical protein